MNRVFNFNLHYLCNNACLFCISHNTKNNARKAFTLSQTKSFLSAFRPEKDDIIILSGGEPSIYPELCNLLKLIRTYSNAKIFIYSNGSGFISENIAKVAIQHADRITLSFYGDKELHDRYAGRRGAYSTLKTAITHLIDERRKFSSQCQLELKYIRIHGESGPHIQDLFNTITTPDEIDNIVLSKMLSGPPLWRPHLVYDDDIKDDLHLLRREDSWRDKPIKLVDVVPCSLGEDYFLEILNDKPKRAAQEILFFDGELASGKIMPSNQKADFSPSCRTCKLGYICGTTATCYGALCFYQGKWVYREE